MCSWKHLWVVAGAMALLGGYAWMALTAAAGKGPAFDEPGHLAAGYNLWRNRDSRLDPANGDLVKRWAALPLLLSQPAFLGPTDRRWQTGETQLVGAAFLYRLGNDPARLLAQGRAMVVVLALFLGAGIFSGSRRLWGTSGAFLSLGLFCFAPEMLAHGALITTDLSAALSLFLATLTWWRLMERVNLGRVGAVGAAAALLATAKLSTVIFLPVAVLIAALRIRRGEPLPFGGAGRKVTSRWAQGGLFALVGAAGVAAGWAAIWACYGFRYRAAAGPPDAGLTFMGEGANLRPSSPWVAGFLRVCERRHLLPEGFLHGANVLLGSLGGRQAFLNGHWSLSGFPSFFPQAFGLKTELALFGLLAIGSLGWWGLARARTGPPALYAATPWIVLVGVYGAAALAEPLNIGHRHLLPLYPPLYILAGSAALWWRDLYRWGWTVVVVLCGWYVLESWMARPDYLAYFNELAGGPAGGFRHLVDSSVDWGMDLPALKRWLEANPAPPGCPVFLSYFGTGDPEYYGIKCRRLPGFFDWRPREVFPLTPGYYVISATMVQGMYSPVFGPWTGQYETRYQQARTLFAAAARDPGRTYAFLANRPSDFMDREYAQFDWLRFARLCAWLRDLRSPDAVVAHSLLIWKLSPADLHQALEGPPAELWERPLQSAVARR